MISAYSVSTKRDIWKPTYYIFIAEVLYLYSVLFQDWSRNLTILIKRRANYKYGICRVIQLNQDCHVEK